MPSKLSSYPSSVTPTKILRLSRERMSWSQVTLRIEMHLLKIMGLKIYKDYYL